MPNIREVQLSELEVLKELDSFCRDNNIKYSLSSGTLLGAIRHNGFIPWDDDVDVDMPLSDCKTLEKKYKNGIFFLQTPKTDIEMPFIMYKLRKTGTLMVEPGTDKLNINQGVWIDIFPYCNASNGIIGKKIQCFLHDLLQTYRGRYRYCEQDNRRIIHYLLTKIPIGLQKKLDDFLLSCINIFGSKKSAEVFVLGVGKNLFFPGKFYDNLKKYQFESESFYGPEDYDEYLRMAYGADYMTPQKWNHIGNYDSVIL